MNSTRTSPSGSNEIEELYFKDSAEWEKLTENGTSILALRDNPRFGFYQNACVWENQEDARVCSSTQDEIFLKEDPAHELENKLENFHAIDLTHLFCVNGICPAVDDDTLM